MGTTFAIKGNTAKTVHGAHAHGPLEIKGRFTMQGPQPIDDENGCPQWVSDLLDQYPDVQQVALSGDKCGVVFSRMGANAKLTGDPQLHRGASSEQSERG